MDKKRKICYWLLAGLFLSLAIAAMITTRNGSLGQFYQDGYEDDWSMVWFGQASACGKYDAGRGISKVEPYEGTISICKERLDDNANFIEMKLTDISQIGTRWSISYFDSNMNLLEYEEHELQSGTWMFELKHMDYDYFMLSLIDDRSAEVKVNSIKVSEYTQNVPFKDILPVWGICYLVYCIISFLLQKVIKGERLSQWNLIAVVENSADDMLDRLPFVKDGILSPAMVRVFLFVWIVIGWRIANVHGVNKHYGYIVLYTIIMFLTLLCFIPKENKKRETNHLLISIWIFAYLFEFISDMLVSKDYSFGAVWMMLCFGLLFRKWNRMERPENLLDNFANAILILNAINIGYIFLHGNSYNDGRPTGTWTNPNPFSIGLVLYETVALFLLYRTVHRKRKWWNCILPGIEFVVGAWLICKSECRTAGLTFLIMLMWFVIYLVVGRNKISKRMGIALAVFFLVALIGGGTWFALRMGSSFSNRQIDFTSANGLTSGRAMVWKEYIAHMNLFGHEKNLVIGGKSWYTHNGIVKEFYKFGLLAGITHVILLIESVWLALCYWYKNKKSEYTVLIMGIFIAYLFPSLMEAIDELPMVWVGWFSFYFVIGYLMQKKEIGKRENEKYE